MKKLMSSLFFVFILLNIFTIATVKAEEGKQLYTVEPILPSNQDKLINNYISITTDKPIEQTLEFLVRNLTKEEITLKVRGFDALTSSYGVIQYKIYDKEKDSMSLTDKDYYLTSYIQPEQEITLRPNEAKQVKVDIDVPVLDGHVLGGIAFTAFIPGKTQTEENVQFKINNEMNTIIGFMANFDEKEKESITYKQPWIQSMPSYYGIFLPTIHDTAKLTKNSKLDYEVRNKKGDLLFESKDKQTLDFTPKSQTNLLLKWESEKLKIGEEYHLKGHIIVDENNIFPFDFPIVLENDDYIDSNDIKDPIKTTLEDDSFNWYWLLPLLLLLPLLFFLFRKKEPLFVYMSDEQSVTSIVNEHNPIYPSIIPKKEAKNNKTYTYHHFYKKVEIKDDNNEVRYQYHYVETKNIKK